MGEIYNKSNACQHKIHIKQLNNYKNRMLYYFAL